MSIILLGIYIKTDFKKISILFFTALVFYLSYQNNDFMFLLAISVFLSVKEKNYITLLIPAIAIVVISNNLGPLLFVSGLFGVAIKDRDEKSADYKIVFDNERRQRYELEAAKQKLQKNTEDIIHITELNERNRIARSIHDNLGHKLVGTKMILEASKAIREKDSIKSNELVERVILEISESVDLLRETVHDLKPKHIVGINSIKAIVDDFKYCEISISFTGDTNSISSGVIAIIVSNLKESLTNITKYSAATKVDIKMESTNKYVRFFIKDNGVGSDYISEGLGLSGMRQRVENIGGTITINSRGGFEICSFFPKGV